MVNAGPGEFSLPLQKFLDFANLVREAFKQRDEKELKLTTELTDAKDKLAAALADDAADDDAIAQAQSDAASARDELAVLKESIANDTNNKQLIDAINALESELGFSIPAA